MASPSDAATKLLYGTGVGMLLVTGFGLIEGRMVIDEISLGWVFAIFGLILLGLGKTLERGSGPLSTAFPSETAQELSNRVREDINASIQDASVGSAWAELEANVLELELSDEA